MTPSGSGKKARFAIAAIVLIVFASAVYFYAPNILPDKSPVYIITKESGTGKFSGSSSTVQMNLPAINANNTGVAAELTVTLKRGTGKILFSIDNALSNPDTQQSARTAALYAANHENISLGTIDLTYDIRASASMIEGPSAGAAFAIATIAALRNRTVSSDAMITGAINHDGTIGPSGKILEKARAAKAEGANVFLAPVGSVADIGVNYTEQEYCHNWGGYEYCQEEYLPRILDVSKEAGIPVLEVGSVDEALKYFLN